MKFSLMIMAMLISVQAFSADLGLLRNDKEIQIQAFSIKEKDRITALYSNKETNSQIQRVFDRSVQNYLQSENLKCEFILSANFEYELYRANLPYSATEIQDHLKMLRVTNQIDDILFELASNVMADHFALKLITDSKKSAQGISREDKGLLATNNISEEFAPFKTWPDDNKFQCAYQEYIHLKNIVFSKDNMLSKDTADLKYLSSHALALKLIPDDSYNKLEYLRTKSTINTRDLWLQDYFKIIFNAKNKMVPVKKLYLSMNFDKENTFSTKLISRKQHLTRRKLLYRKYDSTQIVLLAQLLQVASRRMGTDADTKSSHPVIVQEFSVQLANGRTQNYVERNELDPQSQYNLARRMLRKDMVTLQMMDSFRNHHVTYEDVIMAAFETGYISLEDIDFVAGYDDLWNPTKSQFEKIMGFVFQVTGYSTFLLPPPWNIVMAVALGVTEGIVQSKFDTGASHDNPGTFIE